MLNRKRLAVLALILLTAALLLTLSAAKPTRAATSADAESNTINLVVRPLLIINYSAVPGEKFGVSINVTIIGTTDIQNFTMTLSYDPNLVEFTSLEQGDLLQSPPATANSTGNVYASANFTSPIYNNGTLVSLTFQVKGTGETSLHLYDVSFYNSTGAYLPYTAYDGYFNNKVNFDFTMPLTLLAVTFVSLFLNQRTESKLKSVLEERELRVRDAVLFVALIAAMITIIVVVRQLSTILLVLFLFSYSVLLFTFGYLVSKKRWYLGILAPAVFILLYAFLRDTFVWTQYLSNIYGLVFAVLITLYLAGLFDWTTTAVFGVLITAMDIVLVLVTRTMVQAANAAVSLSLPVLVSLPLFPLIHTGVGLLILSLGLGDFFFAGLLAIQTFKKYGKRVAIASVAGMTISFFIFETFILTFRVGAFPGTLMIICGWLPVVLIPTMRNRRKTNAASLEKMVSG